MAIMLFFAALPFSVFAQQADAVTLKIAYLSGFAKFTKWQDANLALQICYFAKQDIADDIRVLEDKPTPSGIIHLQSFSNHIPSNCQILVVTPSLIELTDMPGLNLSKTLVVCNECEKSKFADIAIYRKRDRLLFNVHLTRIKQKTIKLSSNLLELASEVY